MNPKTEKRFRRGEKPNDRTDFAHGSPGLTLLNPSRWVRRLPVRSAGVEQDQFIGAQNKASSSSRWLAPYTAARLSVACCDNHSNIRGARAAAG